MIYIIYTYMYTKYKVIKDIIICIYSIHVKHNMMYRYIIYTMYIYHTYNIYIYISNKINNIYMIDVYTLNL